MAHAGASLILPSLVVAKDKREMDLANGTPRAIGELGIAGSKGHDSGTGETGTHMFYLPNDNPETDSNPGASGFGNSIPAEASRGNGRPILERLKIG